MMSYLVHIVFIACCLWSSIPGILEKQPLNDHQEENVGHKQIKPVKLM